MITQTFTNKTDICQIISGCLLSGDIQRPTIRANAFNQADSRRKLFTDRQAAVSFAFNSQAKTVFFTLAKTLTLPFPMVSKGKARFIAAATIWQFPTPYPLLATPNRRKLAAALSLDRKGKSIMTTPSFNAPIQSATSKKTPAKPSCAKGKSGFHTWQPASHAPSIQFIVMQIKRDYGADYQAKRDHIHDCFKREYALYREKYDAPAAREMAAYNAQMRVDSLLDAYHDNETTEQRIKGEILARYQTRQAKREAAKAAKKGGAK